MAFGVSRKTGSNSIHEILHELTVSDDWVYERLSGFARAKQNVKKNVLLGVFPAGNLIKFTLKVNKGETTYL